MMRCMLDHTFWTESSGTCTKPVSDANVLGILCRSRNNHCSSIYAHALEREAQNSEMEFSILESFPCAGDAADNANEVSFVRFTTLPQ